ncbi:MAG: hypothetical protein KAS73_06460 [Candidatus Sabulitectum sp.]|nr:hypothetical protein [Candidatus Sabulitectum sp.]
MFKSRSSIENMPLVGKQKKSAQFQILPKRVNKSDGHKLAHYGKMSVDTIGRDTYNINE